MSPKSRALVVGGVVGALMGVLAGLMYYNANVAIDEEGGEQLESPSAGTAVRLGLSVLAFLRSISG